MILIPAGSFLMGSLKTDLLANDEEFPRHRVTVPSFFLSQFPITQAQWNFVAKLKPFKILLEPKPSCFKGDSHPVEMISWYEAREFCQRLSQYTRRCYRLPSEAEWEYACRGKTTTAFHCGPTLPSYLANFRTSTSCPEKADKYQFGTTPVDYFSIANPFGLYDLHGNVYEWCADSWHSNYEGAPTDGSAWLSEDPIPFRVLRGGFWGNYARHCRSAYRDCSNPSVKSSLIGFRVALKIEPVD